MYVNFYIAKSKREINKDTLTLYIDDKILNFMRDKNLIFIYNIESFSYGICVFLSDEIQEIIDFCENFLNIQFKKQIDELLIMCRIATAYNYKLYAYINYQPNILR